MAWTVAVEVDCGCGNRLWQWTVQWTVDCESDGARMWTAAVDCGLWVRWRGSDGCGSDGSAVMCLYVCCMCVVMCVLLCVYLCVVFFFFVVHEFF